MITEEIISNRSYDDNDGIHSNANVYHEIILSFSNIILHSYINNIKHETWLIDETVTKFELNKVFIYYKLKNVKYFRNKLNNQVTIE